MLFFNRGPIVPVLRFTGAIGMVTPLRPGLALASLAGAIEKAFNASKLPSVAITINSPGGSPVQSHLIFNRIRQLAAEKEKRVYVFCEDVAASGGYFLALAGDEIYADPSSIVGSIGVISAGFGLDKFIQRFDIERRVHAVGKDKGALDPFQPERPEDVRRLAELQRDVHDTFIGIVKARRAGRLRGPEEEMFSGSFWSARKARRVRPDRRHRRSAQQNARTARRQGPAKGRADGARRAPFPPAPVAGSCRVRQRRICFPGVVGR